MRPICPICEGRGAVTLNYKLGGQFDVGLCACQAGQPLRREIEAGPERLEKRFGVSIDRIWPLEDLRDGPLLTTSDTAPSAESDDEAMLLNAGKVDRAGLGGKVVR